MTETFFPQFETHLRLPEIGKTGQKKLQNAKLLVIGAGTLGCACLPYLAGAGIGHIRLSDPDRIEPDNLARQPLYTVSDCGKMKAETTVAFLKKRAPNCSFHIETRKASPQTAPEWIPEADLVIDCADNAATSFLLDDLCAARGKILVSAAAERFGGYVGAFNGGKAAYRDIFPALNGNIDCASSGIFSPVGGIIGSLQAHIALSLILGLSPSPLGKLLVWKGKTWRMEHMDFSGLPPSQERKFPVRSLSARKKEDILLDLRPEKTWPELENALREVPPDTPKEAAIFLFCQTGALASQKALELQQQGYINLALCALSLEEGF